MRRLAHTDPLELARAAASAIDAVGHAKLARIIGVSRGAVSQWRSSGIPGGRVAEVAAASGIPAAQIRPDLARVFCPQAERA